MPDTRSRDAGSALRAAQSVAGSEIRRAVGVAAGLDDCGAVTHGGGIFHQPRLGRRKRSGIGSAGRRSAARILGADSGQILHRCADARPADRENPVVSHGLVQRRQESTRGVQRRFQWIPFARSSARRRCPVWRCARDGPHSSQRRDLGRCARDVAAGTAGGRLRAYRRGNFSHHAGARLSARSGRRLRQSGPLGVDQLRGSGRDSAHPARQPRQLLRVVCRTRCCNRRLPHLSATGQAAVGTHRRCGGIQPSVERRHRPGDPFLESRQPGSRAAGGDRGGHGCETLRQPSHRHGGVDEVHGRLAELRAGGVAGGADAAGIVRGVDRLCIGVCRTTGAGLAVEESDSRHSARGFAGAAADCAGDSGGNVDRIRCAAVAAAEEHAARARAAQVGQCAAASLWLELCAGPGSAVGDSLEPGPRHRTGVRGHGRRLGRGVGAGARRLWTGAPHRPFAWRRGCCVALWPRQRVAARRRQRGANRRLWFGLDGTAVTGRCARRLVDRLAPQPAARCAEQFPGQHPARRASEPAGVLGCAPFRQADAVSDGAGADDGHQFGERGGIEIARRGGAQLHRSRTELDLVGELVGGQPTGLRQLVDGGGCRKAAGVGFLRICRGLEAACRRQAEFRCGWRAAHRQHIEHSQNPLGQLPSEFLPGVSAGLARWRRGNLYDGLVPDSFAAVCAGRSGAPVPDRLGVRRGCDFEADPRHHGSCFAGCSVCIPVHLVGGRHRVAGGGAIDA